MTSLLPPEFNTVTLSGQYVNLDGTPVAGYLTFTPSPTILKAAASKDIIVPVTINVPLDGSGHFSIALPATDDTDIDPGNWTYTVLEAFGARRTYSVQLLLENGTAQNIFDLTPVALANGTYYETGPTGPAGPPALIVSGAPASSAGGTGDYAIDPVAGVLYGPKDQVTGWGAGVHLAATDIAAHAALTRTHGIQAGSVLVGTTDTQTLSGKTLAAPTITGGVSLDTASTSGDVAVGGVLTVAGQLTGHAIAGSSLAVASGTVTTAPNGVNDLVNKAYADALGTPNSNAGTIVRRDGSDTFGATAIWGLADVTGKTGDNAANKGYVDTGDTATLASATQWPTSTQTVAYTLALTDAKTAVHVNSAGAVAVSVPPSGAVNFPVGTMIRLVQIGAGQLSVVPGSGVTLLSPKGAQTSIKARAVNSELILRKSATDTWVVEGDMITDGNVPGSSAATANTLALRDTNGGFATGYLETNYAFYLDAQSADPVAPSATNGASLWKANADSGLYLNVQGQSKRRLNCHWGSVAGFPSTGVMIGDTCLRTDLGTNGSTWTYNGTGGSSGWVHKGPIACTSTTRPTAALYAGLEIFETDTGRSYRYLPTGTVVLGTALASGIWDQVAGPAESYAMASFLAGYKAYSGATYQALTIYKRGRDCWFEGMVVPTGTASLAAATNYNFGNLPAAVTPYLAKQAPAAYYTGTGANSPGGISIVFATLDCYVACSVASAAGGWSFDLTGMRWQTRL